MSGYHIREAGATAVQELAFTFANGIAYCEAALARGLRLEDFAPKLFTFLSANLGLLEEVAKFRAARAIWDRIVSSRFGVSDPASRALRIFAFSAGSTLTAQQPEVNVVRVTIEALAAVLGGVQTLHTSAYDEALATPTEHSATLALRTQQVLLEETDLGRTVDPLGGAWAIEALTADLERRVLAEITEVDRQGGALACIDSGWFADQITASAYAHQVALEQGVRRVVGVNCFDDRGESGADIKVMRVDPEIERAQCARLACLRETRDGASVRRALGVLEQAARRGGSIIEPTIEAVRSYATVGEISDCLRAVYGVTGARR